MRIFDRNWMQIEKYLEGDDRIVLPIGSTEQHGYLSLGTDAILAERVAVEAAEPLGVPVLPCLPFDMAPYFTEYPGTMSLRMSTYIEVIRDLLGCIVGQGFRRIAIVNGHGGNAPVTGLIREWLSIPRVDGTEPPAQAKPVLSRALTGNVDRIRMRELSPDGSHGGAYQRSDAEMNEVWQAGVSEVRDLIENGWTQR